MQNCFVAGCSWSDYTGNVPKTYGDIISENYGVNYFHEARGCGSNDRWFRVLPQYIENGILQKDDLIILQITAFERTEIWSGRNYKIIDITDPKNMTDPFYKEGKRHGSVIRIKNNAHEWLNDEEATYSRAKEPLTDRHYSIECFNSRAITLQGYLEHKGFKNVYWLYPMSNMLGFNTMYRPKNLITLMDWKVGKYHLPNDPTHLNEKGHEYIADKLMRIIG